MYNLSLDLLLDQETIEGKEEFPEDPLFTSLDKRVTDWYADDFSQIINVCTENLKELAEKIKTKNIKVHTEGFKEIIEKIWTAIKNFFTKLGSILMFWKKKINTFYSDKTRELQKYMPIADKLNATTGFNLDNLNSSYTTLFLLKDSASAEARFSFTFTLIDRMDLLFQHLKKYVNDPEMNYKDELLKLERSTDDVSFKTMLGVELISNSKEELVPSRINVTGVMSMFESITTGTETKFSDYFNVNDNGMFGQLKGSLHTLLKIVKNSQDLSELMESINKSYKELDDGIKWNLLSRLKADVNVTVAKTEAVVKAKDHITKSKILVEEYTKLLNMMCVTVLNAVKTLDANKK